MSYFRFWTSAYLAMGRMGNCEMCGHTGTTFTLYESTDLQSWALTTTNIIPDKPGGASAALYTPVLAFNKKLN